MLDAIEKAIGVMRKHYAEPLTLDTLANEAAYSKFHFARAFRGVTGIAPGHYLSAVRIFEAKKRLLNTTSSVSDIVSEIGYSSVGSFTTRFTRNVGVAPSQYRSPEVKQLLACVSPELAQLPDFEVARRAKQSQQIVFEETGSIVGTVLLPETGGAADVLVGLFDSAVPQANPIECQVFVDSKRPQLHLARVPVGRWTAFAVAQRSSGTNNSGDFMVTDPTGPIDVVPGGIAQLSLRLRWPTRIDPPVAMTVARPSSLVTTTQIRA
jgi:AraC-like DNA-binding protein